MNASTQQQPATAALAPLDLRLSSRAEAALSQLAEPLHVELELLFSCLVRKRVIFHELTPSGVIFLNSGHPKVMAHFRPVVSKSCSMAEVKGEQEKLSIEIHRPDAFRPKWLSLDFRGGEWHGEFGW